MIVITSPFEAVSLSTFTAPLIIDITLMVLWADAITQANSIITTEIYLIICFIIILLYYFTTTFRPFNIYIPFPAGFLSSFLP